NFEGSKGETLGSQKVVHGTFIDQEKLPNIPEVEGHRFRGWSLDGKDLFDIINTKITKDITLKSVWELKEYKVTFDTDGGSKDPEEQIIKHDGKITRPKDPTKEGYEFLGWYLGEVKFDFANQKVTDNIILTAKWEKIYKVTFSFGDGKTEDLVRYYKKGETVEEPKDKPIAAFDRYGFDHWAIRKDSKEVKYDFKTPITEDLHLVAKYKLKEYKVTFNTDQGSKDPEEQIIKHDGKITRPKDPTKEGYEFLGWYLGEVKFDFANQKVTDNIILTAKWEKIYKVTFSFGDGKTKDLVKYYKKGETVEEPKVDQIPVLESHKFDYWAVRKDSKEVKYDFKTPISEDLHLVAKYRIKEYKITFDTDGGSKDPEEQTIKHDGKVTRPDDPKKEGYEFLGWYLDDKQFSFDTEITKDITLIAKWEIKSYTVTFNSDGGSDVAQKTVKYNETVGEIVDPTKDGHTFKEWQLKDKTFDLQNEKITENITLKAVWEIKSYTVTFNSDGGSDVAQKTVKYNETVGEIVDPTKDGHTFKEWQLKGATFDLQNEKITENITLKAVWEINSYTVTFDSDGGSDVAQKTVQYDQKVEKPADPTKVGHNFKEWQLDEKPFDFETKITKDVTLKAVWTPIATPPANPPAQGNPSVPANPGAQPAQPAPQPPTTGGGGGGGGGAAAPTTITDNAVPLAFPEDDTIAIFKIGSKEYQLKEDGKLTAKTSDLAPLINRSRTMLPVRITGEVLGIKADYDNKTKTAKFTYIDDNKKENIIEMTIGKNKMKVNGVEQALTADIMVVEGRMILPISDVQKAFRQLGLKVEILWNNETKEVTLIRTDK
ncbi:MAG: InlB B-repeat-containing protein, partial [Peptostreptococcaceae bacterium]|nr:InlB B-repeat-containing protein [Peptostreptococcaceae bacterium]